MKNSRIVGTLLTVGLLTLSQVNALSVAPGISLDFNSLPSAQGWTYDDDGGGVPENDVFSVNGTSLMQNTLGLPFTKRSRYFLPDSVNPLQPYTLEMTARVLNHEANQPWWFGFVFGIDNGSERIEFGLTTTEIAKFTGSGTLITSSVDNTQFHNYRLEGTPGVGWELFVDDISLTSGSFGSTVGNRLVIGDTSNAARAEAEITSLTLTQIPEPSTFTLLGLGSLALAMVRRKR